MGKNLATFAIGALVAGTFVYYKVKRGQPEPATPVEVAQTFPAEAPVTSAAPAPTPSTAAEPVKALPRSASRPRAAEAKASAKAEPPVQPATEPKTPTPEQPAATPPSKAATPAPTSPPAVVEEPKPAPPAPRKPRTVTIAAGTIVSVRLSETLSSDRHQPNETFQATLDEPLVVDGLVIAERGARVEGRIVEAQRAGRVQGVAALAIQMTSLKSSDGQTIGVETETFRKEGPKSVKDDAAKVGAAAGIGAAIGAIAGGGKGAAIGAAVGGAAGTGGVVATRGKPAELPVETRISFQLSQAVSVSEKLR